MNTVPEILEIPIVPRRKSLGSALVSAVAVGALTSGTAIGLFMQDRPPDEIGWVYFFAVLFGLGLAIPMFAFSRQTPRPGVLRIEPDHVRFQSSLPGAVQVGVPLADLWAAHREGRGSGENLIFKGRGPGLIAVGTAFLPAEQRADSILEAVRRRVALLPDGPRMLEGITARQAVAERIYSGRRTVVFAVAILLGLVFLAELATGALADPFLLWAFGANSFRLVLHGDLFRLATSSLLHGSVLHLVFNVMVLINLGSFLEPLLGTGRFLSLLLVSAVAGAAGSAFLGHHALALGASTGIAGLIAAYAVILWRWPDRFSNPPTRKTWLWMAFAFVGPALFFPNIDHTAHLAGFVAGLGVMLPEIRKVDLVELAGRRRGWFRGLAAFLILLFLVAGGIALRRAGDPERDLKTAAVLLHDTSLPSTLQNSIVWRVATSPAASRDHLAAALSSIERATEKDPEVVEYQDTRATVLYRLGRWEEAVRAERAVVAAARTPFHVSQLARFEWALAKARGPLVLGQHREVLPRVRIASGASVLVETGEPRLPPGTVLHLVLARGNKPYALLELTTGAADPSGDLGYNLSGDPSFPKPDEVFLTLVDPWEIGDPPPPGETSWTLQGIDPEAARLP